MNKVFKYLAYLQASLLLLGSLTGCDHSGKNEPELTFSLGISDVTATSAKLVVTPSKDGATYYYDLLGKEAFDNMSNVGIQAFFDAEVDRRIEAYSLTREEVLEKMLSKGQESFEFKSLEPMTDYYVVVFGVDASGKADRNLVHFEFSTEAVSPSANILVIDVKEIYDNGADYVITPTVEADEYAFDIWSKSLVDELGNSGTIKYFIEYNDFMMPYLTTSGTYEFDNATEGSVWQPNRDYYVVAFGYSNGEPTTGLFKQHFRTTGGDPATCSFTIEAQDIKSTKATIKVVPSDKKVVYIWNAISMVTYNVWKSDKFGGDDTETLKYILNGNIEETMEMDGMKRQQAVENLGRWSGFTSSDEEGADIETLYDLPSDSEILVWAVAVDELGEPEGEFYTYTFRTTAD